MKKEIYLTDMQLKTELLRCEYCEERPCENGCPVNCSPFDFIMAAKAGEPQDFARSAGLIMKNNPLGGVCGCVCPDRHCMAKCSHKTFDGSIGIPDLQSLIVKKAKGLGGIPAFNKIKPNGKKVAIVGSGPAGLGAASVLAQYGYKIVIYEVGDKAGGMCNLIPDHRLPKDVLKTDIDFVKTLGDITIKINSRIDSPDKLLDEGFDAVVVAVGLWQPIMPNIGGQELSVTATDYLINPEKYKFKGKVAVIGGGASALDCAVQAKKNGATGVEMFSLENLAEMPLTSKERNELLENDIEVTGRVRVLSINGGGKKIKGITTIKITLPAGKKFNLKDIKDVEGAKQQRTDISNVIMAIGNRAVVPKFTKKGIFLAGDCINGPTTVVEAVASGKNCAVESDAFLARQKKPKAEKNTKSHVSLTGYVHVPVSLETDFFGRKISTPFLLSAAPPSDGYDQMKKAYEKGWSGGIMKTAFDNVPIHIPGEYMHVFNETTYGNCDNVSGHHLERVMREVEKLVKEYPDRLTMASTGGPVTGNDENDRTGWQSNTRKLEGCGVMGIEYSLSCPQGGDGTEGDIVSQNARLTAKIINWIMEAGNPDVPKLFKLTAAVTSIAVIVKAIKEVLDSHPGKKAGITLANTFPVLAFQDRGKKKWEDGVVLGMSGESVTPISYLTLASAVPVGVVISGNGGPVNYKQASHFLALGVQTVQFCTMVTKYGYGIFGELCNGVSYLMKRRGILSMKELIGIARPDPIKDFMALSPTKKISSLIEELCVSCGNCARCPYQAITLNKNLLPEIDPAKCIGCSICTKRCFVGALEMRERTKEELGLLKED
ncbi:MAG: FAD-dependent oxidoreductase [Elusimicrobiota bacterium]